MRPIKFRFGYTDGTNWIFKTFTLDECLNGDPLEAMSNNPLLKNYVMKSRDLFTGLHDKNGKEIYEGDIVMYCEIEYKIIYQANEFHCGYYLAYMFEDNSCLELGKQRTNIIEVIGNIYEKEQ